MMNLKSLSFEDLGDMQIAIEQIRAACATLASLPNCGGQLLIDMTPGEPVRISTHFAMPPVSGSQDSEPVDLVEADPQELQPSFEPVVSRDADATTPLKPAPQGIADQKTFKKGPLDAEERAIIARMVRGGKSTADIAKTLNHRPQLVGQYVAVIASKKAAPKKKPAPKPIAAKTEVPAPEEAKAEPAVSKPLSARASTMLSVLNNLKPSPDFDAEIDLEIVEAVFDGQSVPMIATDFGLDGKAVFKRFQTLTSFIRDNNGALIEADKEHLLASLRRRVQISRNVAA